MSKPFQKTVVAVLCASLLSSACTTIKDIEGDIRKNSATASAALEQQRSRADIGAGVVHKGQRLGGEEIAVKEKEKLPAVFSKPFPYGTKVATAREIIKTISARTGIPVILRSEQAFGSSMAGASMPGMVAMPPQLSGQGAGQVMSRPMDIEWTDSLSGLLDHLALSLGEYWKYEDGRIHFFEEETKVFNIQLPPGMKSIKASIALSGVSGGSGGAGGSGGQASGAGSASTTSGGTVSVDAKHDVDPFTAIVAGVSAILRDTSIPGRQNVGSVQGQGTSVTGMTMGAVMPGMGAGGAPSAGGQGQQSQQGKIVSSPELGMITVTAAPPVLERVSAFVDSVNKRFARNILIDVKIYNLALNKEAAAGVNADINKILLQRFTQVGVATKSPAIIQPASGVDGGQFALTVQDRNDASQVGSFIARAMEGIGDVSLEQRAQVIAVNGQPAPFQTGQEIGYLASKTTNQVANAGATSSLVPGSKIVGLTGNFVPTVMADNRILLQYQLSISSLANKEQVGSSTDFIQTLTMNSQSLQQQAYVNDGQALVLFGYDQNRQSAGANVGLSGISKAADQKRQMSVIVMQVYTGGVN